MSNFKIERASSSVSPVVLSSSSCSASVIAYNIQETEVVIIKIITQTNSLIIVISISKMILLFNLYRLCIKAYFTGNAASSYPVTEYFIVKDRMIQ